MTETFDFQRNFLSHSRRITVFYFSRGEISLTKRGICFLLKPIRRHGRASWNNVPMKYRVRRNHCLIPDNTQKSRCFSKYIKIL